MERSEIHTMRQPSSAPPKDIVCQENHTRRWVVPVQTHTSPNTDWTACCLTSFKFHNSGGGGGGGRKANRRRVFLSYKQYLVPVIFWHTHKKLIIQRTGEIALNLSNPPGARVASRQLVISATRHFWWNQASRHKNLSKLEGGGGVRERLQRGKVEKHPSQQQQHQPINSTGPWNEEKNRQWMAKGVKWRSLQGTTKKKSEQRHLIDWTMQAPHFMDIIQFTHTKITTTAKNREKLVHNKPTRLWNYSYLTRYSSDTCRRVSARHATRPIFLYKNYKAERYN